EGSETLELSLSSLGPAVIGAQSTATLTILDNDTQVQFSAAVYSAAENLMGTSKVTLVVKRTGPATGTSRVQLVDTTPGGPGSAVNGSDYAFAPSPSTRTFNRGVVTQTVVIPIHHESGLAAFEGPETATFTLNGPTGAGLGPQKTTTVKI